MDDGQKLVGHFGITTFGNGVVIVTATLAQVGVTAPVVRDDQRPRSDRAIDKSAKGFGASVSGDRQPRVLVDVHENQRGRIHTRSPFQAIATRASRRPPAGSGPTHRQTLPLGVYASTGQAWYEVSGDASVGGPRSSVRNDSPNAEPSRKIPPLRVPPINLRRRAGSGGTGGKTISLAE